MGDPQGQASYDIDAMKAVASKTENVAVDLDAMATLMNDRDMTSAAFGEISNHSNVKSVFESTWTTLTKSLTGVGKHVNQLAGDVETSAREMQSRDENEGNDMSNMQGEL